MQQTIGKYELGDFLGKGTVGSVYEGTGPAGQKVAVKIIKETALVDVKSLENVIQIAAETTKIPAHPHVTSVLDYGKQENIYYVVMQLVPGNMTLESLITEQAPLDLPLALKLAYEIADALAHAHSINVVHGDLKPGNILIDEQNKAMLNDFVCVSHNNIPAGKFGRGVIGTPKYMSPQQAQGQYITSLSDVYSFGVVLYEMLTAALPYNLGRSANLQKMIAVISNTPPVPPRRLNNAIPRRLNRLIMHILEKEEDLRIQKMSVIRNEIESIIEGTKSEIYTWAELRGRLHRWLIPPPKTEDG